MKLLAGVGVCGLALGLAACGSSDDGQNTGSNPAATSPPRTKLAIISPDRTATVRTDHVDIRGTVVPPGAQVLVLGKTVKVSGGFFRASAPVQMGTNTIDVVATANDAEPATTTILVTRGRTPAQLAAAVAAKRKHQAHAAAVRKARAARVAARRAAKADKSAASTSSNSSNCIVVPNVVGKNHQTGQDTMQAAGLYVLDEQDATGQGRMLLWDRNWVDVAQDPAPGRCVSPDSTVMLSAKKIGE